MSGLDTAGKGRASELPPIKDIAAEIRDGATVGQVCEQYDISKSTLQQRFSMAGFSLTTGQPQQQGVRHQRLESQHLGAGGQHVGGGDYLGLPTKPVQWRGKPRGSSIDWATIDAQYVANGGQINPDVWPKVKGEVVVMGANARSHKLFHTIEEHRGDDYDFDNDLAQAAPTKQRRTTRLLTDDQCRAISLKYRDQLVPIRTLADEYGVSISAIRTALRFTGETPRTRSETNRLRTKATS